MKKNDIKNDNNAESFAKVRINWYPGHMAKTKRQIEEDLKLIDVVVEIRDSRIPISSQNPDIKKLTLNKEKIIVLNKCDLADKKENELWLKYLKEKKENAVLVDCTRGVGIKEVLDLIQNLEKDKIKKYEENGRIGRKIKVMVLRNSKCWKIFFY